MRTIYSGDWHFAPYSGPETENTNNMTEKLYFLDKTIRNMCDYALKNQIGYITSLGDIYHTKSMIYTSAQSVLLDLIREYKELKFILLQGNHDLSSRSKIASSTLKGFKSESNVIVIDETKVLSEFPTSIFIPYTSNIVQEVKKNKADNLFSHFGLNEGVLNSGISIVSDISIKDLASNYKNVVLGHYHGPQTISGLGCRVWYTGSPIQLDEGEKNEDKRFLIFDDITSEMESIPTEGYRKLYEYKITEENKEEVLERVKFNKSEGHDVRVLMTEKMDIENIEEDIIIIDKTEKDIMNRGLSSTMTQEERLQRYMEIEEVPEKDREIYLIFGKSVINEVNSG